MPVAGLRRASRPCVALESPPHSQNEGPAQHVPAEAGKRHDDASLLTQRDDFQPSVTPQTDVSSGFPPVQARATLGGRDRCFTGKLAWPKYSEPVGVRRSATSAIGLPPVHRVRLRGGTTSLPPAQLREVLGRQVRQEALRCAPRRGGSVVRAGRSRGPGRVRDRHRPRRHGILLPGPRMTGRQVPGPQPPARPPPRRPPGLAVSPQCGHPNDYAPYILASAVDVISTTSRTHRRAGRLSRPAHPGSQGVGKVR